jgi:UDP-3-O-[3-hydroxymyristoyl] glucosamine N-acyltransferase
MPDPRFYTAGGPFTLAELARIAGAELRPDGLGERAAKNVAPLDAAGPDEISFLDNPRYVEAFKASRAGACLVSPERAGDAPRGMALLITKAPYRGYALVAQAFYPDSAPARSVARTASVDPTTRIGDGTEIEPGAVVAARAEIGKNCVIGAGAIIGPGVVLGDDVRIGPCASLRYALVGSRVRIAAGARIGEDGFGFAPDPGGHVRVPQLGRVIVGDDVEIGANTTIDRGAGAPTVNGARGRIVKFVQIGHKLRLGRGCIIIAQSGISGSTVLEDHVVVAAQGGLTGHLTIGAGARIGAQAGVMRDVGSGETVIGSPAVPHRQFWRQITVLARLTQGQGKRDE